MLKKLFGRRPNLQPQVVPVFKWTGLRLTDWVNDPDRVEFARKLFEDQNFRDIITILHNEHPVDERAEGYRTAIHLLYALTQKPTNDYGTNEPDWGAEDIAATG